MRYKLFCCGKEIPLRDSEMNREVVNTLQSGQYPGLAAVEGPQRDYLVNLSEGASFVLEGNEFPSASTGPRFVPIT